MKAKLARATLVALMATAGSAQAQSITDAQSYLSRNASQQEIFLTRQLRAQADLIEECAPGTDANSFRPLFNEWLAENPRFLNRTAQLAVTAALIDLCNN